MGTGGGERCASRLRQRPPGVGVGGEARVVDGEVADVRLVLEVLVEFAQRLGAQHALVHHRAARQGAEVAVVRRGTDLVASGALDALAEEVERPLQLLPLQLLVRLEDDLLDHGHGGLGHAAHHAHVHGDVADAHHLEPVRRRDFVDDGHALRARGRVARGVARARAKMAQTSCVAWARPAPSRRRPCLGEGTAAPRPRGAARRPARPWQ